MAVVAKVATEAFLMVLSVLAAPEGLTEFRIDAVGSNGYMDTMIVRRIENGFELYDDLNNERINYMTIRASKEKPDEYVVTTHRGDKTENVNPSKSIQAFDIKELRTSERLALKTTDDSTIQLNRSGSLAYLALNQRGMTFVVHCYEPNQPSTSDR